MVVGSVTLSTGPASADAAGSVMLNITNSNKCRYDGDHDVMQGSVTDGKRNLYIVFTKAEGAEPVLTRWTHSDTDAATAYWVCQQVVPGLDIGHANDLAYQEDYNGVGKALLITRGIESAPSPRIGVVPLASDGSIRGYQATDIVLPVGVSGFCHSATANSGNGGYVGQLKTKVFVFEKWGGGPSTSYTTRTFSSLDGNADQGMDCSANNIWLGRSINEASDTANHVFQIQWSGSSIETITVDAIGQFKRDTKAEEIEDIFHNGSSFFVGLNRNDFKGAPSTDLVRTFSE